MTYARGRPCWDADSHLMPEPDFLARHCDADIRDEMRIGGGKNGGVEFEKKFGPMIASVRDRIADPGQTAELEKNVMRNGKGWYAHGAVDGGERSRTLDLLGFSGQLVFSTFAGHFILSKDLDLMYRGTRAHTRAMADFCSSDERLMAVALVPLMDPKRALEELNAAIDLGCKAIHVPSDAPGGNTSGFAPSHVDLEPFWARLAETGIPAVLHVGGGKLLPKAYHENGRERPTDWLGGGENLRSKDFPAMAHSPENFMTTMIFDGVFERHPGLRCGVIELGASWVPGLIRRLDHAFAAFRKTEPLLQKLSLKPSEYIRRQIKFTPFCFEDAGWLIEQAGEELFLFSSDYPHPEGGRDPMGRFEASFDEAGITQEARTRFYSRNFEELFGIGAA